MTEVLWWLALGSIGAAVLIDVAAGGTAALVAALVATGVTIAAAIVDGPREDGRPW